MHVGDGDFTTQMLLRVSILNSCVRRCRNKQCARLSSRIKRMRQPAFFNLQRVRLHFFTQDSSSTSVLQPSTGAFTLLQPTCFFQQRARLRFFEHACASSTTPTNAFTLLQPHSFCNDCNLRACTYSTAPTSALTLLQLQRLQRALALLQRLQRPQ